MLGCGVCLRECREQGQLPCQHALCDICSKSKKKCMICSRGDSDIHCLEKRLSSSIPAAWANEGIASGTNGTKPSSPSRSQNISPNLPKTASHPNRITPNEGLVADSKSIPLLSDVPDSPHDKSSSGGDFDGDRIRGRGIDDEGDGATELNGATMSMEPILSKSHLETFQTNHRSPSDIATINNTSINSPSRSNEGLTTVHAPTAFDEVHCELRPELSAPKIARPALRASGKLSVAVLRKFLHTRLNLLPNQAVLFRCVGEDLVDEMTLGQLGAHVWPKSAGHIVLEYRVTQSAS